MTMTPEFIGGRRLRAADLNRVAREAESAHPGFAGFLAGGNGRELVVRSPRRDPAPRGAGAARAPCPQWRITAAPPEEEGGPWTVAVQGGSVVVSDISLDSAGNSGGGSGGSGGDGSGDGGGGGSGHSHGGGGRSGGPGDGEGAVRVPEITYGG